jgi:hypothetical protein
MTQRLLQAFVFLAAAVFGSSAWATDKYWTGAGADAFWNTSGNWVTSTGGATGTPGTTDRVLIYPIGPIAGFPITVVNSPVINAPVVSVSQLVVRAGATLTIQSGQTLDLNGYAAPYIDGGGTVVGKIRVSDAVNGGLSSGIFVNQSMTLGSVELSYNGGGNVNSVRMIVNNPSVLLISGDLNLTSGSLQLGQNPNGTVTEVNVRGNISITNKSIINFKTNGSILHCGGDYTQGGQRLRDGNNTTMILDGSGTQTVIQNNASLNNVNLQNLVIAGSGVRRTVNWMDNPQLAAGFQVVGDLTVGPLVSFNLYDGVAAGGLGTTNANFFRIEDLAIARFTQAYTCAATLVFRNGNSVSGSLSTGLLRLENTVAPLAGGFTCGLGTVEYGGAGVAQTVAGTLGAYYNLVIDTTGGAAATQNGAITVTKTLAIGRTTNPDTQAITTNAAAIFTGAAANITVGDDFICNGTFNNGGSTVILTCGFDHAASILTDIAAPAALLFNNLTISAGLSGSVMDVVTAARSFAVANTFSAPRGKLTLSPGVAVDAQRGITVGDNVLPAGVTSDAELELIGNVTFRVGATFSLTVQPDGVFFAGLRNSATAPVVTRVAGPGTFASSITGVVDISRLNYSFGNVNGLNINTPAAKVLNLRNITFGAQDATLAGTLPADLTIVAPGLNIDCPSCVFGTLVAGGVNVRAKGAATNMILRFEDRGPSPPGGGGGGPGAGELLDDDNDANDNGLIDGAEVAGGSIVQWVYTINLDVPGAISGFPQPAFDWNTFNYYSTYVVMQNSSGTTDTLYVLNGEGDLASYSFTLPGADIVGPAWWSTEGGTHVVYVGTSDGRVFKLIDTGSALAAAPAPWDTPYSDPGNLLAVTSPVISDGTNVYFAGQSSGTPTFAVYKVAIATKTVPNPALSIGGVRISSGFAWWNSPTGRYLYGATQASGGNSYIGRALTSTWTLDALFSGPAMNPPADDCTTDLLGYVNVMNFVGDATAYLYVGEANGYMHGVNAAGTALQFLTQRAGFPFRDKVSAIQGGAVMDFFTGRLFFGNAAGDLYTLKTSTGTWTLNTNYFRFATPGGAAIRTMPLFESGMLYASNSAGQVFVLDANNGAGGQTLVRTYNLGTSPLGDISRDFTTSRIYVATAGGRLYSIPTMADPTAGAP